jgi:hypothetical protein
MVPMPEYALILHDSMFSTPDKGQHAHFLFENNLTSSSVDCFFAVTLISDLISVHLWEIPRSTSRLLSLVSSEILPPRLPS